MSDELSNIIKKSFEEIHNKNYKSAIEMLYPKLTEYPDNVEIITQIARCYNLMGEVEQAFEYYEKAFDLNQKSTIILDPLIELKLKQGDYSVVEKYVKYYLDCDDKVYAIQKYLETLKAIGNNGEIKAFSDKVEEKHLNSISLSIIGEAILEYCENNKNLSEEERLNQIHIAEEYSKKTLDLDKNNINAICTIAKCHINKEEYYKLDDIYNSLPQLQNSSEFLSIYGFAKYTIEDYAAAIDLYSKAIEFDEENDVLYFNLAEAYVQQGWLDEAEVVIKKAIALNEKSIENRLSLANIYYMSNDFDKTLLTLAFVNELDPNNEQMNLLYAYTYAHQNNFTKAKMYAERIENKINSAFIDSNFAAIHFQLGQKNEAYELIEKAIAKEPENISFWVQKAEFLFNEDRIDEIKEIYDKILEINPNYVDAYYQKASIYYSEGSIKTALDYAKKAVEKDCNNPEYQSLLALIYAKNKDYDKALACAEFALSITPNDIEKYRFIGYLYLEKGDKSSALSYFKEILSINQNDFEQLYDIANMLSEHNIIDEAYEYYQKAFRVNPYDYDFIKVYSDFVIEKVSVFKGINILLNFAKYTKNKNLKKDSKLRIKNIIKNNKNKLNFKEKLQLLFK